MNNYLLQLLKEVKTIIIPGLGALTLTNEATGEMMFMPYLKYDDGTLAKHISEKEGMELNDAKNLISKFVREVTAELDKGNSYDMYQFGSFKKVDGDVAFEQWSAASAAESTAEKASGPEPTASSPEEGMSEVTEPETASPPEEEMNGATEPETAPEPEPTPEPEQPKAETPEPPITETLATAVVIDHALEPTASNVTETPAAPEQPLAEPEPVVEPATEVKQEPAKEEPSIREETPILEKAHDPTPPKADEPLVKSEQPSPLPPKDQPKKTLSPKERLAAEEAKKKAAKKDAKATEPKKKRRVLAYVLWGFVVLILGGATYVAVNFDTLKKDFPILADLAGDNNDEAVGQKELDAANEQAEQNLKDSIAEAEAEKARQEADDNQETIEETPAPEPMPEPEPVPAPVSKPKPEPKPKPAPKPTPVSKPKPKPTPVTPVSKPKPRPGGGSSNTAIGSPDPSKPFHVIGGSFGSEANAKRFARQLIASGHASVIVGEFNGMYRVSLASFPTKEEAMQAHSSLKSEVAQAWVFKWP